MDTPAHYPLDGNMLCPFLFNRLRSGKPVEGTVTADGRAVTVTTGSRSDTLAAKGSLPPPGTEVLIQLGRYSITAVDKAAWLAYEERARQQREAAEAAKRAAYRARMDALRDEARAFNAQYELPVAWTVGQKSVLSGLSEHSYGDGRNRASVDHILLKEDLAEGRLRRRAGDFLCSSRPGYNGKRWTDPESTCVDGSGQLYAPKISCKSCLTLAERWKTGPAYTPSKSSKPRGPRP